MSKDILYNIMARTALLIGIDKAANAVKTTLGPKGRNVVINKPYGTPVVTNDGATIAKSIDLLDPLEAIGAALIKSVAEKTNEEVGDGTTTAIVLAQAMIKEGLHNLASGANPVLLNQGIRLAVDEALKQLEAMAEHVHSKDDMAHIAAISAKDSVIGDLLTEAFDKLGIDCAITVEASGSMESFLDIREGFQFDKGYISKEMINVPDKSRVEYHDVLILYADKKFHTVNDIYPIMEYLLEVKKPLLMIVDELEDEALQMVNINNLRGIFHIVAVQGPTHGENRVRELNDFAALTGGQPITEDYSIDVKDITPEIYGYAAKIIVSHNNTAIIGGKSDANRIKERIAAIKDEMNKYPSEFTEVICNQRLERLSGGVAVLKLNAMTEVELSERKLRAEDAINAARSAVEKGIIAGGGAAYVHAANKLDLHSNIADVETGIQLVKRALTAPLWQIAQNAGVDGAVVVQHVQTLPVREGYNAAKDICGDMFAAGIIDPVKAACAALENAASIARMVLTTESLIGEHIEK